MRFIVSNQGEIPWPTSVHPRQVEEYNRQQRAIILQAREKRKQREAEQAEAREQRIRERGAAELEQYRAQCERAWLHNGGDEHGFERAWPKMQEAYLTERATGAVGSREQRVQAEMRALRERYREPMQG